MPEALVRASLVIVAEELAKDALEVIGTEDENVVEKLPSHRAHAALGEGIGVPLTRLSHLASKAHRNSGGRMNHFPFRSARFCLHSSPTEPI